MSNEFALYTSKNTFFIVKNVTPDENKVIRIFNYPILFGETRDLMQIPGVAESDIRASLLKGEIRHKFEAKDIEHVFSNIDLLQFSAAELAYLNSLGIIPNTQIGAMQLSADAINYIQSQISGGGALSYLWKENIDLIGLQNGLNRTFFTPDLFLDGNYNGNTFNISVFHNGRKLARDIDYTISESGGPNTGFNTVNFTFSPISSSTIRATYAIKTP